MLRFAVGVMEEALGMVCAVKAASRLGVMLLMVSVLAAWPAQANAQVCPARCLLGPPIDDDSGRECTANTDCNYCNPNHPEFDNAVCNNPEVIALGGMCHVTDPCVHFEWRPMGVTVAVDGNPATLETIDLGLFAVSSGSPQEFTFAQAILNWDPTQLRLLGKVDPCTVADPCTQACPVDTYRWLTSTFPNDCNADAINTPCPGDPENDGDAFYIALSRLQCGIVPAPLPMATAAGLHITTFQFEVLGDAGMSSNITLPFRYVRGDGTVGSTKTEVVLGGAIAPLTGVIPGPNPVTIECIASTPDCNMDGVGDVCQLNNNDCNSNVIPDDCDLTAGTSLDCNSNSIPDECDTANLTSLDCNLDGIPDECELLSNDCNANSVPDDCDIADLTSPDCNLNGIPDECEPGADCNSNGIPDECETDCNGNAMPDDCDIAAGTSLDCNSNSVPDECDLTAGTSLDCNTNAIPDECDIATGGSLDCDSNGTPDDCQLAGNDCNHNGVPDDVCDVFTIGDCNHNGVPDDCDFIYVDDSATTGLDNGSSWADAYVDLQSALDPLNLLCPGVGYVRVAGGVYTPGTLRTDTFLLLNGVSVTGGYAGAFVGPLDPDTRDSTLYESVLSGDIGVVDDLNDNCYHVVTGSGTDASAVLDGFTITRGNANLAPSDVRGGGMYNSAGSPTVNNCAFVGNRATSGSSGGGGMANLNSSPSITNCLFSGNKTSANGGGIHNENSGPAILNCTFSGNGAGGVFDGGGVYSTAGSTPTVGNSVFWGNVPDQIFYNASSGTVSFSDLQGAFPSGAIDGGGNISADPVFVRNPDPGLDGNIGTVDDDFGDLRLTTGSPCTDVGDNTLAAGILTDILGNNRFEDDPANGTEVPPVVDMGAYEFVFVSAVAPPALSALPGETTNTQRYLVFSALPQGGTGATLEVIRIRVISLTDGIPVPATDFYVGAPFAAPDPNSADSLLTFTAARMQCEPFAHTWPAEGKVAAYGAEIMPGSQYDVQRSFADCAGFETNEACWSSPLTITTPKFGDVVPPIFVNPGDLQPDFKDITAYVAKFLGDPTAPSKAASQLQPNIVVPANVVDFRDISNDVGAFLGVPFSSSLGISGPCTCPSAVTCGVTACTVNNDCPGGLCIDGGCVDSCGRCSP